MYVPVIEFGEKYNFFRMFFPEILVCPNTSYFFERKFGEDYFSDIDYYKIRINFSFLEELFD